MGYRWLWSENWERMGRFGRLNGGKCNGGCGRLKSLWINQKIEFKWWCSAFICFGWMEWKLAVAVSSKEMTDDDKWIDSGGGWWIAVEGNDLSDGLWLLLVCFSTVTMAVRWWDRLVMVGGFFWLYWW